MNKAKALGLMKNQLKHFKYIYKKEILRMDLWHLIFEMDLGLPEVQMSIEFTDKYLDILAFPHPRIATEDNFDNLLRIINYINWNIKGIGRFYVDDYQDMAYSVRIKYKMLESLTELSIKEIEFAIDLYSDLLKIIFDISTDKIDYKEGKREIELMWNIKDK